MRLLEYREYRLEKERGFHGHRGRPGQRGGSLPRDEASAPAGEQVAEVDEEQAYDSVKEIISVYPGTMLGSLKGKIAIYRKGFNSFTQTFDSYAEALKWLETNMATVAKR